MAKTKVIDESFQSPSGLKKDGSPKKAWLNFQERMNNWMTIPCDEWSHDQVIGYVMSQYESTFGQPFGLSYSGSPTKSKEAYVGKRILIAFNNNPVQAKSFLDWLFEKIKKEKISVNSLGFFFTPALISRFKKEAVKKPLNRASQLPQNVEAIATSLGLDDIVTYGDLVFVKNALSENKDNEAYAPYEKFFEKIQAAGFNLSVLDRLVS